MLVESKSNLARLMATENLLVEQRQVSTAVFDLKNRVLTVPILDGNLSPELYDLLLGHEVGHALETPPEGWHDSIVDLKVNRSILNVCEDARIEKKIKRKFPGIRISFVKGYRELMEKDFFGVNDKNINDLNFIDRINLHTKGGAHQIISFTSDETVLLNEVEQAETFQETVDVALKIQAFMKEEQQNKKTITINVKSIDEEEDEKLPEKTKSSEPSDLESGDVEIEIVTGAEETENKEETDTAKSKEDDSGKTPEDGAAGSSGSEDFSIESETDKSFREQEEKLFAQGEKKEMLYANVPKIILENVIINHKTIISEIESYNSREEHQYIFDPKKMLSAYNKFRVESNKVVSHLVKEFEMRKNAGQQARAQTSKTGELNLSRIHEYQFTDDIFARMTKVPNGKSHGLVMFIDWSGSMVDHINSTVKQLLNLVLFCKKVNIPFDVYAFSSRGVINHASKGHSYEVFKPAIKLKVGDITVQPFSLLNILSHKMSSNEFTKMASYLLNYGTGRYGSCSNMIPPEMIQLSGTPLNEAIMAAFEVVPEFKKQNRLEIVNTVFLTDGEGNSLGYCIKGLTKDDTISQTERIGSDIRTRSFLRDDTTKSSVEIAYPSTGRTYGYSSAAQTNALLKLLKQRTNSNIIGFYVAKVRDVRHALGLYACESDIPKIETFVSDFRKNNFTYLNNTGYDEYYFLRSDKIDTDEEDEFQVVTNTTRGLVSAFSKYTGNRISNRIVLNRFINLIA